MKQLLPNEPVLAPPLHGSEKFFNAAPKRTFFPIPSKGQAFHWHTCASSEGRNTMVVVLTELEDTFVQEVLRFLTNAFRLEATTQKVPFFEEMTERLQRLTFPANKKVQELPSENQPASLTYSSIFHNEPISSQRKKDVAKIDLPTEATTPGAQEDWLAKVNEEIEKHLEDEDFGSLQIARAIGVCEMQLYRKLKHCTCHSTANYIRKYRLQRSQFFLSKTNLSVKEVCFKVGFHSMEYFSRSFRKEFGMSPSDFKRSCLV